MKIKESSEEQIEESAPTNVEQDLMSGIPATQDEPDPHASTNVEPTQPMGISTQAVVCRQVHEASVASSSLDCVQQSCGAQASLRLSCGAQASLESPQLLSPMPVIAAAKTA